MKTKLLKKLRKKLNKEFWITVSIGYKKYKLEYKVKENHPCYGIVTLESFSTLEQAKIKMQKLKLKRLEDKIDALKIQRSNKSIKKLKL